MIAVNSHGVASVSRLNSTAAAAASAAETKKVKGVTKDNNT